MDTPERSSWMLSQISLLADLPEPRLAELARDCIWRPFATGAPIVPRQGDSGAVHFVISGRVRVMTVSAGGRQVNLRDFRAGEFFGELSAIDGQPRTVDFEALENGLIASIPGPVFLQLLDSEPLVARRQMERLVAAVRDLSERVIALSTAPVSIRVQRELLRLAGEHGIVDNQARLQPVPRHVDLAARVGTSREQVTRELSALGQAGLVLKVTGGLLLADIAELRRRASGAASDPG